jgi:hypothetical protein
LKSLQAVNFAEAKSRFHGKPLLDEISISRINGMNEMAYAARGLRLSDGVDNHGELRSSVVNRLLVGGK